MIDRLKIWLGSKPWFWTLRDMRGKIVFLVERIAYKRTASIANAKANTHIIGSIAWVGLQGFFWVVLCLASLIFVEDSIRANQTWLEPLNENDEKFNIDQLRLYAQLLTAIFSIFFATIGIILSAGYTRLRRDIIHMLTNEQVGSVYSRLLVFAAMFSLGATTLPSFGLAPGLFVYFAGTLLTVLSAIALFPLGQRLFNFFDLTSLVRSEILPSIVRHIKGAAYQRNSSSLANHHSKLAQRALEQLSYIDDRIKTNKDSLKDNLTALTGDYTTLILYYLSKKHLVFHDSYWFPRRRNHKEWFFAGDTATSIALETSDQQQLVEEKPDYQWLENQIVERLANHIELAFEVGDFDLALKLLNRLSIRISAYAAQFQFDMGMKELRRFKEIIEKGLATEGPLTINSSDVTKVAIADTWAALGSNLCLETFRRMFTFEKEIGRFFDADDWSENSLHDLPAFLQVELSFVVERINFEKKIEGRRLSGSKYVQQLAIRKLMQHYDKILIEACKYYRVKVPEFVSSLTKVKQSRAATQVVLASLHSHWKLPRWFDELADLFSRWKSFEHYSEANYILPIIDLAGLTKEIEASRDEAITMLCSESMVGHIFEASHNGDLPDHFGQIYFELAQSCVTALEKNDADKLEEILPMFLTLAFNAADLKFTDPKLEINDEFRLHLISTVINDFASILGFAILYGAYFGNQNLSEGALAKFDAWIERATDQQLYLKRMVMLSDPNSFSMSASPRGLVRINWKMSFERLARQDGYEDRLGLTRGEPHPNKLVRAFLNSFADASHLFFAIHILPKVEVAEKDIDHHIISLAQCLAGERDEGAE